MDRTHWDRITAKESLEEYSSLPQRLRYYSKSMNYFNNFFKKLPWITGFTAAFVWGLVYILFAKLHGMQVMFDEQFPFFVAWLLSGTLFAMLDALILGSAVGWLLRNIVTGKK